MTHHHVPLPAVEFEDADRVDFVEHPPPSLTPEEGRAVDRLWARTTARNPETFDGPLVASLGIDRPAPGHTSVRWARTTYRHRELRRIRPAAEVPGSVFVTVLLPTEDGLAVGRGSRTTAAPGRWTLPGGAAEPPPDGQPLDLSVLRAHAARELAEELGVRTPESALRLRALTRGTRFGSLGFHFLAPPVPAALVRRHHARLAAAESAYGAGPELDAIAFVAAPDLPDPLLDRCADYLPRLLDHHFTRGDRADGRR
ncbi:NUDIX domain-containing protein [Streptomyces sp. NPDC051921]|uniref:NUDIX domain-containing protein n=1 Tax=Streptomyces sp. NPDC051921 TaxID=3155806 RepID=UPI003449838B